MNRPTNNAKDKIVTGRVGKKRRRRKKGNVCEFSQIKSNSNRPTIFSHAPTELAMLANVNLALGVSQVRDRINVAREYNAVCIRAIWKCARVESLRKLLRNAFRGARAPLNSWGSKIARYGLMATRIFPDIRSRPPGRQRRRFLSTRINLSRCSVWPNGNGKNEKSTDAVRRNGSCRSIF